jgi:hypothetical protein
MFLTHFYYELRPFIPRRLQVYLRRKIIRRRRLLHKSVWPIDESTAEMPDGWTGWPEEKRFALILTHDVETAKGQEKCYDLAKLEMDIGFRSSFGFVPERYVVDAELRHFLAGNGFEVAVHDLLHDGKLYRSRQVFQERSKRINQYLREWNAVGFRSGSMHNKLDWLHNLDIEYDSSTFDTDPFEPQPDGIATIFPFLVHGNNGQGGYVELPYTIPQDFTLFVLMKEKNINIWKKKLDWIAEKGGMALLPAHPDYMNCTKSKCGNEEYPMELYEEFLDYIKDRYEGQYWNSLPREIARFWKSRSGNGQRREDRLMISRQVTPTNL